MLIIMCLRKPLKLKSSWHFVKWITLNIVFMTHHIYNVLRFFTALQPFFYIYSFKRGTTWRRFWVQRTHYWNSKVLLRSWLEVYFFTFLMVIFTTLFWRGPVVCKSTLKMTTLFGRCPTLTLFNVVNSNADVRNIVSTLIWCCTTSRRRINLKTTSKQRWNVCWVVSKVYVNNGEQIYSIERK